MVITILDHVKQCQTNADGEVIYKLIKDKIKSKEKVIVSFKGIISAPSSFVNTAFITLLDDGISFDDIKKHLTFRDSNSQINSMIKSRFKFEVEKKVNNKLVERSYT